MDWWQLYKEHAKQINPPFLERNLKKVYSFLDEVSILAQQGFAEAKRAADIDPNLPVPTWSELITVGAKSKSPTSPTRNDDTSIDQYCYKVTGSRFRPPGTSHPGFAELKVRNQHGKLIKWFTCETAFVLNGKTVYLMEKLELLAPKGMLTLEIFIPSLNISFEQEIMMKTGFEYNGYYFPLNIIEFQETSKGVRYYMGDRLLEATQGYTCALTGKPFGSFEELYDHHLLYHPSIQFAVHPTEKDSFTVDFLAHSEKQDAETLSLPIRFFKPNLLSESIMEKLLIPNITLLPSQNPGLN